VLQRDFKHAAARTFEGLGDIALPPSAAMARARNSVCCASSGNVSNSRRAALSQEIGRVGRIDGYVGIFANICKATLPVEARLGSQVNGAIGVILY
jgi:hypothetical protein